MHARRQARRLAMQALYQWQMTAQSCQEIFGQFVEDQDISNADQDYFRELLCEVIAHVEEIDALLTPYSSMKVHQIDPVERALLRIAGYELKFRIDVPYRVVINEAVGLAKKFGAEQSYRFVNGLLDQLSRDLRPHEERDGG
ncbi:MAG: transcription antitermination factor NusB [Gammaproteobacteria bacterium]|jgi:N utilization substance protein B